MEIDLNNLHHAYLIEGDTKSGVAFVFELLSKLGLSKAQNPDFFVFDNPSFTIDEAREMSIKAQGKAFGSKKIFLISSPKFSVQAQNALLKTLEEPYPDTHFFIVLNNRDLLIPTLLSRLEVRRVESVQDKNTDAKKFLEMNIKERMSFIKKFVDQEKPLSPLVDALLLEVRGDKARLEEVRKIYTVRKYSDDPSAMSRLILEHLALVLK